MDYDFSVHTSNNIREHNYLEACGEVSDVERMVLYGTDLRKSRIPRETALPGSNYQVVFQDVQGCFFGMSESLLSKHLLLLGGIGCGKTNVFHLLLSHCYIV